MWTESEQLHSAVTQVLYGLGYVGGVVAFYCSYVIAKELLFLWHLQRRAAHTP